MSSGAVAAQRRISCAATHQAALSDGLGGRELLPLGDNVLTNNLGLPIVVVLTKVCVIFGGDTMRVLCNIAALSFKQCN